MKRKDLTRRDFGRLSAAALGGVVMGASLSGCSDKTPPAPTPTATPGPADPMLLTMEPHICRGMNTCKGKGAGADNACAGQGKCANAQAHSCKGQNECKGQGGCGENAGRNSCKGHGECNVPLKPDTWANARKAFEEQMKKVNKTVGAAPAEG